MSSQRVTRSSTRVGLKPNKMETTMVLKRAGSVPVRTTRQLSKEVKEERMKRLLHPIGEDPPLDAVNTAKRIIELEHELIQCKKSKKDELELELAGAMESLKTIAREVKEENQMEDTDNEHFEEEDEEMGTGENNEMLKELDAIEKENAIMEITDDEEKDSNEDDMEIEETNIPPQDEQEETETQTEQIKGDFVHFKPTKSSLKQFFRVILAEDTVFPQI